MIPQAGTILCMRQANERWRYIVTSALIGWAHPLKDPGISFAPAQLYFTSHVQQKYLCAWSWKCIELEHCNKNITDINIIHKIFVYMAQYYN